MSPQTAIETATQATDIETVTTVTATTAAPADAANTDTEAHGTPQEHEPHLRGWMLSVSRTLSMLFTPFYLPMLSIAVIFTFTHLYYLPFMYKLQVFVLTYVFTILLPTLLIRAYRMYNGWSLFHLTQREKRMVPYITSIASYLAAYYIMRIQHVPSFLYFIIVTALIVQIVCALFNLVIKISIHTAGIGGVTGGVVAFSYILGFNALWWIVLLILLAGCLGTARMILRVNTLGEVCLGFIVGLLTPFMVLYLI